MRLVLITTIIVMSAALITWIRADEDFPIAHVLPFMGGDDPGVYDVGALVVIGITIWGITRLSSPSGEGYAPHQTEDDEYVESDNVQPPYVAGNGRDYDDDED